MTSQMTSQMTSEENLPIMTQEELDYIAVRIYNELHSHYSSEGSPIRSQPLSSIIEVAWDIADEFFWRLTKSEQTKAVSLAMRFVEVIHPEGGGV